MKSPNKLKCEYLINPQGIDTQMPRFGWTCEVEEGEFHKCQSAYRIIVASKKEKLNEEECDLWDSGKVVSASNAQIYYHGKALKFGMVCYWKCMVWDEKDIPTAWSSMAEFSIGFMNREDIKAKFISCDIKRDSDNVSSPILFAKSFALCSDASVKKAKVYMSALGVYEGYLNDHLIHSNILAPEWTNYKKRVQYQTYDVTSLLKEGINVFKIYVGNGWYSGIWQDWPPRAHIYGEYPELFVQLEVEYTDGTSQTLISDESWKGTADIKLRFSDIYEGEKYDATVTEPLADQDDGWNPVEVCEHPALMMNAQKSEPIQVEKTLSAQSITEPVEGVYVVDFGQNAAGRLRSRFRVPKGTEILIKHNEMLNPDGTVYMDNLWAGLYAEGRDRQLLRYVAAGNDEELYRPHFTYMGFRYVEIHGLPYKPKLDDFHMEVIHTNLSFGSIFETSDQDINRLQQNICWSEKSNMMGVPTDCPQRDERCGYTGDMNFFAPTALFNSDIAAFMNKWLIDVCQDAVLQNGSYSFYAPYFKERGGSVGWSDAATICTYLVWKAYGDTENIARHYDSLKRYTRFLNDTANEDYTRGPECVGLGDWLNLGGGASKEVIGTAFYAYHFYIMKQMAEAINRNKDAAIYYEAYKKVKKAFAEQYIREDGRLKDSSLTGYALAFTMGLVPNNAYEKCVQAFAEETQKFDYKIATGFIGTPRMLPALHSIKRDDIAEEFLFCKECPSWLYPVTMGATTIWERWDGWTKEAGFANRSMNSFNHFAFGSVGDYFFSGILGIRQQEKSVAYNHVIIEPAFLKRLDYARGEFDCMRGRVAVAWSRENDNIRIEVKIPVGMNADICLYSTDVEVVSGDVKSISVQEAQHLIHCDQGTYQFLMRQ